MNNQNKTERELYDLSEVENFLREYKSWFSEDWPKIQELLNQQASTADSGSNPPGTPPPPPGTPK